MRRIALVSAALLVVVVAAAVVAYFWPTDGRAILLRLMAVAETASAPGAETAPRRVARLADLGRHFTPDVRLEAPADGVSLQGRDAAIRLASTIRPTAQLSFYAMPTLRTIRRKSGHATADIVVRVVAWKPGEGAEYDGMQLDVELTRVGREWLISRVTKR